MLLAFSMVKNLLQACIVTLNGLVAEEAVDLKRR